MTMPAQEQVEARDAEAAMWCLALADGGLSIDDQRAFDAWIADEDNSRVFEEALRVWRAADQAAELPEIIRVRTQALQRFRRVNGRRWNRRLPGRWFWAAGLAAMLALAFGASLLNPSALSYQTGVGERQVAMLSDGTRLSLDADTRVDVRLRETGRDLTLVRGRAKFDVARDPLRPFSVTAGGKVVVATGTSFSVELLRNEARVLLYEGHVAVLDRATTAGSLARARAPRAAPPGFTALEPGRELVVALDSPLVAPRMQAADPVRSLTWEGGQLNFDDEPLASAVERVNRYSDRKVVLGDPRLASLHVNGVFEAGDIAAFVEAVATFNRIRVVEGDNEVILRPS